MLTGHESRSTASAVVMLSLSLGGTAPVACSRGLYSERRRTLVPRFTALLAFPSSRSGRRPSWKAHLAWTLPFRLTGIEAPKSRSARLRSARKAAVSTQWPEQGRRNDHRFHGSGLLGRGTLGSDWALPGFASLDFPVAVCPELEDDGFLGPRSDIFVPERHPRDAGQVRPGGWIDPRQGDADLVFWLLRPGSLPSSANDHQVSWVQPWARRPSVRRGS
jgi:hypothetical protein